MLLVSDASKSQASGKVEPSLDEVSTRVDQSSTTIFQSILDHKYETLLGIGIIVGATSLIAGIILLNIMYVIPGVLLIISCSLLINQSFKSETKIVDIEKEYPLICEFKADFSKISFTEFGDALAGLNKMRQRFNAVLDSLDQNRFENYITMLKNRNQISYNYVSCTIKEIDTLMSKTDKTEELEKDIEASKAEFVKSVNTYIKRTLIHIDELADYIKVL